MTEEHKLKISEAKRGRPNGHLGLKHRSETKSKISKALKGRIREQCCAWKGGRRKVADGYIYIYAPIHPYALGNGYVAEHRLIMETHLGRVLLPSEVIHHINSIKDDNRYENLMLFANFQDHFAFHRKLKKEA